MPELKCSITIKANDVARVRQAFKEHYGKNLSVEELQELLEENWWKEVQKVVAGIESAKASKEKSEEVFTSLSRG